MAVFTGVSIVTNLVGGVRIKERWSTSFLRVGGSIAGVAMGTRTRMLGTGRCPFNSGCRRQQQSLLHVP